MNYDGDECLEWPFATMRGYAKLNRKVASRTLCERIHGPPPTPKHEAAHSCGRGDLKCITKRHISWKTRKENLADMVEHGTVRRGARATGSVLKPEDIPQIRALCGVIPQTEIALMFGTSQNNVSNIKRGKSWTWL